MTHVKRPLEQFSTTPVRAAIRALDVNYHALLERSPDAVVLIDVEQLAVLDANLMAQKLFGLSVDALLQRTLPALCPPTQADGAPSATVLRESIEQVLDGAIRVYELDFLHASGRLQTCEMRLVTLPDSTPRLMHVRLLDITQRKLDEALRTGQNHLLELIARGAPLKETLGDLMLLIESQSRGVYCSVLLLDDDGVTIRPGAGPSLPQEYMAALDGFPIGPIGGSCGTAMYRKETVIVSDIEHDPLWAPYVGLVAPYGFRACWSTPIILRREQVLGSFAMYYKEVRSPVAEDMRLIGVATHLAGIAIERTRHERELAQHRENLEGLVAARTNELTIANRELAAALSNLRQAQEELVRRDKLAALGALVAGVAHGLNTPIGNSLIMATTMAEHTSALARSLDDGIKRSTLEAHLLEAQQASDILVRNLQRAADLVLSFKEVAVDQANLRRRLFSLTQLLGEIVPALTVDAKQRPIAVVQEVDEHLEMDSYPEPLTQVLSNLFTNCLMHAFEQDQPGTIWIKAHALPDRQVAVTVQDNGAGIAEAHLRHVYEPFFTSKLGSGGTGLGLHVAHNIVTGILGGRIELGSAVGNGTTFTLVLPVVAPEFTVRS